LNGKSLARKALKNKFSQQTNDRINSQNNVLASQRSTLLFGIVTLPVLGGILEYRDPSVCLSHGVAA